MDKRAIVFKTKINYCGIPAGTLVEGVHMRTDVEDGYYPIGVRLIDNGTTLGKHPMGYFPDPPSGAEGGWWYAPRQLRAETPAAAAFKRAHLAEVKARS